MAYREIDGQVVILEPLNDNLMTLNETGSAIWSQLGERTVAQIAQTLRDTFEVTDTEALNDILAFLSDMQSRGLVFIVPCRE